MIQMRILPFILMALSTALYAQKSEKLNPEETFDADSLKKWTVELMAEVSANHPGFYRYTTKERFDFLIDSTMQTITAPLTSIQYYRKLKPFFAHIGCLHTSVTLPEPFNEYIERKGKLLPFEVFINKDDQVFITQNYSDQDVPLKGEILSIDGKPMTEILQVLRSAIPSDGYNQTLKTLLLNHRFALWYQTMIDIGNDFTIEVKDGAQVKMYHLKGVASEQFPSFEKIESADKEQLKFEVQAGVGYLTIHTFAKSTIKRNGQRFKRFIKQTFKTLHDQQIEDLVIDLRYNTGGTDSHAAFLAAHFFDEPFRYWEKVEVTEKVADQIKGFYSIFFPKPVKKDTSWHWRGARHTKEFDYYKVQKPAKNNYKRNVYLITNGLCMSSCSDFVAILSHNKKATVVGQESGGGYQGNTSGMMPTTSMNAHLEFTIPLQKYTNAVDPNKNIGRGTIPDHKIQPTLDDWMEQKDVELLFIKKRIKVKQKNLIQVNNNY